MIAMPNRKVFLTTSWDDGHPSDLRVAKLLDKYGLTGTFYIPRSGFSEILGPTEIRELRRTFEIGAHTLNHRVLTKTTPNDAWEEITSSKSWIESVTSAPCLMFCPPEGKYSPSHLKMIGMAGYVGLRSAELASLDFPRFRRGCMLMPTTIQVYPHRPIAFARNAVKRMALGNLLRVAPRLRSKEWRDVAVFLLCDALSGGGVFHLWGHSWELQTDDQWRQLEDVLRTMSEVAKEAPCYTNGQVCQQSLSMHAWREEITPNDFF
jgi:peptidoglycan/xylan/chitin deacetylase (PgdA/CDA1 family)